MNIGMLIQRALKSEGRKQVWLVEKLNERRHLIGREEEYSTSLFSYKMKNDSFTVPEFLIICSILEIDVESLKKAMLAPVSLFGEPASGADTPSDGKSHRNNESDRDRLENEEPEYELMGEKEPTPSMMESEHKKPLGEHSPIYMAKASNKKTEPLT